MIVALPYCVLYNLVEVVRKLNEDVWIHEYLVSYMHIKPLTVDSKIHRFLMVNDTISEMTGWSDYAHRQRPLLLPSSIYFIKHGDSLEREFRTSL